MWNASPLYTCCFWTVTVHFIGHLFVCNKLLHKMMEDDYIGSKGNIWRCILSSSSSRTMKNSVLNETNNHNQTKVHFSTFIEWEGIRLSKYTCMLNILGFSWTMLNHLIVFREAQKTTVFVVKFWCYPNWWTIRLSQVKTKKSHACYIDIFALFRQRMVVTCEVRDARGWVEHKRNAHAMGRYKFASQFITEPAAGLFDFKGPQGIWNGRLTLRLKPVRGGQNREW